MDIKIITLPADKITDWKTFHDVFKDTFGFPEFYGRNMNAWNDCMEDLDEDTGMTSVQVNKGGLVVIKVENSGEFAKRCPEQYEALTECTAFVNYARTEIGSTPVLALMMIGSHS